MCHYVVGCVVACRMMVKEVMVNMYAKLGN